MPMVVFDRARLMTITIDGRLDVWDFEPFKQAIYKDRGVVNQPDIIKLEKAAYDAALDITGHPSIPNLCMVVTRCNVMASVLIRCKSSNFFNLFKDILIAKCKFHSTRNYTCSEWNQLDWRQLLRSRQVCHLCTGKFYAGAIERKYLVF